MSDITWHVEMRVIKDLKEYHKNPRKITNAQFDHLKVSLTKFGLIDLPFINLDNTIIGGHQRLKVLQKMGYKECNVNVPSRQLNDKEVEELNYRHNENGGFFDYDMLANKYEMTDLMLWGDNPLKAEEVQPKAKKAKAIFEFKTQEALQSAVESLQELSLILDANLKIKD